MDQNPLKQLSTGQNLESLWQSSEATTSCKRSSWLDISGGRLRKVRLYPGYIYRRELGAAICWSRPSQHGTHKLYGLLLQCLFVLRVCSIHGGRILDEIVTSSFYSFFFFKWVMSVFVTEKSSKFETP